jgi:hypothetical protein
VRALPVRCEGAIAAAAMAAAAPAPPPSLLGALAAVVLRRRSSHSGGHRLRMVGAAADAAAGRGVAAGLSDINNTGESNAALWQFANRLLAPLYRLIGGKQRLWPPSRESAPLLVFSWCLLCTPLWFLLREHRNKDVEVVEGRRREYALSSLENLIANERVRLEGVEKEAEEKAEKEKKRKEEAGEAEPEAAAAAAEEEEEEEEDGGDDDDTKIPPPAEKLFELLYDEIEHRDITYIGVDKDDKRFVRGMELLRIHTSREIREAIDKTRQARELKADFSMLSGAANLPKDLHQFKDGEKMQKRTRFAKTQVRKYMRAGVSASPEFSKARIAELDALIKEATDYSKVIGSENRRALKLIWALLRPFYRHIGAGTFIKFCGETMGIVWWTNLMQLPYIANRPVSQ